MNGSTQLRVFVIRITQYDPTTCDIEKPYDEQTENCQKIWQKLVDMNDNIRIQKSEYWQTVHGLEVAIMNSIGENIHISDLPSFPADELTIEEQKDYIEAQNDYNKKR